MNQGRRDLAPGRKRKPAKPLALSSLRRLLGRVVRYAFYGIVAFAALTAVLPLLYRVEAVHPVSTLMMGDILSFQSYERDWVEIDNVAPALLQSVVMSEDGQFCSHYGIDLRELNAVISDALDGERPRGASTITMQTAKNLFLWNSRSFVRKALEIPLAVWIDLVLPKKRIMEIYLNIAEWGDGIYGVEAASWHYFGRPAADLTQAQAALIAVTLPNPYERDPAKPGAGLRKLAGVIEGRARKSGAYIACLQ
jgi:monofunctional glycosyltransferase